MGEECEAAGRGGRGTGSEAAVRVRVTVGEGNARPQAETAGDVLESGMRVRGSSHFVGGGG